MTRRVQSYQAWRHGPSKKKYIVPYVCPECKRKCSGPQDYRDHFCNPKEETANDSSN